MSVNNGLIRSPKQLNINIWLLGPKLLLRNFNIVSEMRVIHTKLKKSSKYISLILVLEKIK